MVRLRPCTDKCNRKEGLTWPQHKRKAPENGAPHPAESGPTEPGAAANPGPPRRGKTAAALCPSGGKWERPSAFCWPFFRHWVISTAAACLLISSTAWQRGSLATAIISCPPCCCGPASSSFSTGAVRCVCGYGVFCSSLFCWGRCSICFWPRGLMNGRSPSSAPCTCRWWPSRPSSPATSWVTAPWPSAAPRSSSW